MRPTGIELQFEIEAFEPATIPMVRLAEYMADLAKVLGSERDVHFVRLKKGSTTIVHRVEAERFPDVRGRAYQAPSPDAPEEIKNPFSRIQERLKKDNAKGARLYSQGLKIFEIKIAKPDIAPYPALSKSGTLQGVITRIGGKGEWVPVHLEDVDGTIYICEAKRDKTKELARHYLGQPIRVFGLGRWSRRDSGGWDLENFRIHDFVELTDESLVETLTRLRNIPADWKNNEEFLRDLHDIRYGPSSAE